ncbi:caspase family protein [Dactylosporangium matsuzakiense]|uniref:caspase family protein n=1 Tax=Dactylosporangium matsuzakiense TaxID=53360 RepID=UPI0021C388DC|nr:caspase family protein [Dactylosporangium matsuzakiense]UWZ47368.1 caspase family protein [Dactylosporangium matsuzakiense]
MRRDLQAEQPWTVMHGSTDVKRALLVGIDAYRNFPALRGCVNDVRAVDELLATHEDGAPNFGCQLLDGPAGVSGDEFRAALTRLFAPGADIALLYFSGHGAVRNNDLVLATTDGTDVFPGVAVAEIMGMIAKATGLREVVIILDCCFSGAAAGVPHVAGDSATLRPGLSILTAARADQPAVETGDRGLFSTLFCGALAGGAADVRGRVTISGLYAYLSECFNAWHQRPTFKANIDRAHDLRRCLPSVPDAELRRLPELFPTPEHELPLDPSYEPSVPPTDDIHQADFAVLQRARSAKLVEPVGTPHLYFAALESLSCRLTPLGRHYRLMAEQRLL